MDDKPPPVSHPLTDQALQRLRRLAAGNRLAPEAIVVVETVEKSYILTGILSLTPSFDKQKTRYPGGVKGSERQILSNFAAIQQEAQRREQAFRNDQSWIAEAKRELANAAGSGWGLDKAKITFPEKIVVLAASEPCPSCQGRKQITCAQCQGQGVVLCQQCRGQRQEVCYNCGGRGENPNQPGQLCTICHGTRFVPCRVCRGMGQMTCPTCHGQRGTACPSCNGSGLISEELGLGVSVETSFRLVVEGLPSGLRRGLDRLGIANLAKGHADIALIDIPDDTAAQPFPDADLLNRMPQDEAEPATAKMKNPELHYQAVLPYADIRLRFGQGRVVLVSVFGKKAALLNVPPFLDTALEPVREKLKQAAQNASSSANDALKDVTQMRAIKQALELVLMGRATEPAMRRLYPFGMTSGFMTDIFQNLRKLVNRQTLRTRLGAAVAAVILSGLVFGGLFATGYFQVLTAPLTPGIEALSDGGVGIAMLTASWGLLSLAVRMILQRRFPAVPIAAAHNNGKIGLGMMAAITALFVIIVMTAPVRPHWLFAILKH